MAKLFSSILLPFATPTELFLNDSQASLISLVYISVCILKDTDFKKKINMMPFHTLKLPVIPYIIKYLIIVQTSPNVITFFKCQFVWIEI